MDLQRKNPCQRCIGGTLLVFGDEVRCINCGWQAPPQMASAQTVVAATSRGDAKAGCKG